MLSILYAFLACSAAAGAVFIGLTSIGVDKDVAKLLATLILGAFPKLRELIEKALAARRGDPIPDKIQDLLSYKLSPLVAYLYATIAGYAAVQAGSFFGGVIGGIVGARPGAKAAAAGVVVIIFSLPILYLCGRWIGRRSRSLHYLIAIGAGVSMRAAIYWIDPLYASEAAFQEMRPGESSFWMHFVAGAILYSCVLLIGTFVGIRQQLSAYFGYLLKKLPRESRVALVELAHDEAVRITAASVPKAA